MLCGLNDLVFPRKPGPSLDFMIGWALPVNFCFALPSLPDESASIAAVVHTQTGVPAKE
jgi:hypothetical protein